MGDLSFDVAVCGAGPAGCALAAKLAQGGADVLLLEKKRVPSGGREWVVDVERNTFSLARVPEPEPEALFVEPRTTMLTTSDGKHSIDLGDTPLVPLRNLSYVRQLSEWAKESGARLKRDSEVVSPVIERGFVTGVGLEGGGFVSAKVVADCTGIGAVLRTKVPPKWKMEGPVTGEDTVLARREVLSIDRKAAAAQSAVPDGIRLDRAAVRGSYSVEMRFLDVEEGFVDVLVGVRPGSGQTAEQAFAEVVASMPFAGKRIFGGGAPIPIRRAIASPVGDGFVALGDSACQVIPLHGSGTASALLAADIASSAILDALERGLFDRKTLWPYASRFMRGRGAILAYYDVVRKHAQALSAHDVDRLIEKGLMAAGDVRAGLTPRPFRPTVLDLLKKAPAGMTAPGLVAGFAATGLKADMTLRHYRRYPAKYDEKALRKWISGIPR